MSPWLLYPVQILYLFAPLLLSAALSGAVLRFNWWSSLYRPLDFGRSFRGTRIFGDSKTWRGVIVAVVGCLIGTAIQKHFLSQVARGIALLDYEHVNVAGFASAMGLGAMLGELPNSFTKRRLGIAPGKTTHGFWSGVFYVWDQIDLLVFSWPLLAPWVKPTWQLILASVAVALLVHPLTSLIGYMVGARRTAR